MPYRIPGALDRSSWPLLQILHVEKRGLQFNETRVSVWGRRYQGPAIPDSVTFSHNDRRLFEYRFPETAEHSVLPEPFAERIRAVLPPPNQPSSLWEVVKPIRAWNADRWYLINVENGGLRIYDAANGHPPPQEALGLFRDLEQLPRKPDPQSERADVCLGFCYDPLSEFGFLFANERCYNAGHGTVCR